MKYLWKKVQAITLLALREGIWMADSTVYPFVLLKVRMKVLPIKKINYAFLTTDNRKNEMLYLLRIEKQDTG